MARLDFITGGDNFITSNGLQYRVNGERPYQIDSFEVVLYQTDSDPRTIGKYKATSRTYTGSLRKGASLVNPIITIEMPQVFVWNYVWIPIFQRYYFVVDVISLQKNLYEIHLKCDVLETYKEGILSLTTRVLRSEDKSIRNDSLTDTTSVTEAGPARVGRYVSNLKQGTWFYPREAEFDTDVNTFGNRHLLVKICCSAYTTGWAPTTIILPEFGYVWATMSGESFQQLIFYMTDMGVFEGDFTISDVIMEVKWLPCEIKFPVKKPLGLLRFGISQVPWADRVINCVGEDIYVVDKIMRLKSVTAWEFEGIPLNSDRYKNSSPYKTMAIDFAPFGQIPIKSQIWGNSSSIRIECEVDCLTGDAALFACATNSSYRERLAEANVAYPIDITRYAEQGRQRAQTLASILGSIATGTLASVITMNPLPAITSAISGVGHAVAGVSPPPKLNTVQGSGQANALTMLLPELHVEWLVVIDPNPHTQGYLANKDVMLGTIGGYCVVAGGVHVEKILKMGLATKPEIEEIESLLTSGVILPTPPTP